MNYFAVASAGGGPAYIIKIYRWRAVELEIDLYYVYVLKSLKNGKRYVGYTEKLPDKRLSEHNSGKSKWTKHHRPLKLVYSEKFDNKTKALKRELFLKSGQGRKYLDDLSK